MPLWQSANRPLLGKCGCAFTCARDFRYCMSYISSLTHAHEQAPPRARAHTHKRTRTDTQTQTPTPTPTPTHSGPTYICGSSARLCTHVLVPLCDMEEGEPGPSAAVGGVSPVRAGAMCEGEPGPGARFGWGERSPGADEAGRAQSSGRCCKGEPGPGAELGRGEPTPGADVVGVGPLRVQTWHGRAQSQRRFSGGSAESRCKCCRASPR